MLIRAQSLLPGSVILAAFALFDPSNAHAELQACGGIFLATSSACEYRPTEECMTQCMTVAVEESCVAQVYDSCETSCTLTASTECESTCTQTCVDGCTTKTTAQAGPSCFDLCIADCDAGDGDSCGTAAHRGPCGRCEKHNCAKRCEAKCGDAEAPQKVTTVTECMPTCTNACSASCTAKANTQCQVNCQEQTYTQCEQKMVEHCNTECKQTGGAIFCDGQFVNAADANSCADELRLKVNIDIDIDASIKTVGDTTKDAANDVGHKIDKACSVSNVGVGGPDAGLAALLPLTAVAFWRVRRRRTHG